MGSTAFDFETQPYAIPPTLLESRIHPLRPERIQSQIDPYFDRNWRFENEQAKKAFFIVGLCKAYSLIFSFTFNDRVETTCRMHYLALLVDGESADY
jgi:aristolochene synthase